MTLLRRSMLQMPFVAAAAGPAFAQGVDMAAIAAAAVKQGKLNLLHNIPPPLGDLWIAEFQKAFPKIAVEATRLGSTEMMQRFGTEYQAGASDADLLVTLWDETLLKWSDQGWLRTWTPPESAVYPAHFKARDQIYTSHLNRSCLVTSKTKIKEADAPKEWTDFFDPKWQGKIGMDPPWRSVAVQAMLAVWDQQGIKDVAKRLKANGVRFFNGSAGVVQAVIRGDIQVAAVIDPPVITALADDAPIRAAYPASGVPTTGTGLMMPVKAPHPEAAQVFLNWAVSQNGQKALLATAGAPVPRPDAGAQKLVPGVDGQKILMSSDILTPAMQKAMIEEWRTVFGLQ